MAKNHKANTTKRIGVNFNIDEALKERIDAQAARHGLTRNAIFERGAMRSVEELEQKEPAI